jgi:hypothetical protein
MDMTSDASSDGIKQIHDQQGRLDVVINYAGTGSPGP